MSDSVRFTVKVNADCLKAYKKMLRAAPGEVVQKLCDLGVTEGIQFASGMGAVYTGDLVDSFIADVNKSGNTGYVRNTSTHAAYVEYGTGVIGSASPHPNPGSWAYDVNGHGEAGWVYLNPNDGKFHWTAGYYARPYMYETARELERQAASVVEKAVSK